MKLKDCFKSYIILFILGITAGILCRLSDFFPYENLWSLSSVATMFGFWIASVAVITYYSSSHKGAFLNTFLYMFGMTLSFYLLKYILGFFLPRFDNQGHFQTSLFLTYSLLSVCCGIGSLILYNWNRENAFASILCAMPASGMLAEAIGCVLVLCTRQMLLGQTLFDLIFAILFGIVFYQKAPKKILYLSTLAIVATLVFLLIYKPSLLAF